MSSRPHSSHVTGFVQDAVLVLSIGAKQWRDIKESYALRDQILAKVSSSHADHVVLDLQPVEFIGSVGLLALLGLRRHLQGAGSRIVVCNVADPVRDMFEACRLISPDSSGSAPFELETTVDAALSRLTAN